VQEGIFFGGSVIAAVVAGSVALFAPCCISVMLPAYFASSFQNRGQLVAMTFVFAAGIATVVLPIALGAAVLLSLISGGHTPIYIAGGLLMLALGAYILAGGKLHLPMPGRAAGAGGHGPLAVYSLGLFSGVASSCCAPVLAGVVALSGLSASALGGLGLGGAYVLGMVAPLFVMALLWDAFGWRGSWLLRPRSVTWRVGSLTRTIGLSDLASGAVLTLMGGWAVWLGLTGSAMPSPTGWQARAVVGLQQVGHAVTGALSVLPNWAVAVVLVVLLALLVHRALTQMGVLRGRGSADREVAIRTEDEHEEVGGPRRP
jgi:cytochrome c-type biogenesis protein